MIDEENQTGCPLIYSALTANSDLNPVRAVGRNPKALAD